MEMPHTVAGLLSAMLLLSGQVYADNKLDQAALLEAAQELMAPSGNDKAAQDTLLEATKVLLGGAPAPTPTPTPPKAVVENIPKAPAAKEQPAVEPQKTHGTLITKKAADGTTTTYFKVAEGSSLSAIAIQIYGDAQKYHQIYDVNQEKIVSPNQIPAGITLLIPDTPPLDGH